MYLWDLIKGVWNKIRNFFRRVIHGVLDFFRDILGWFEELSLSYGDDIPFVVDARSQKFKKLLNEAPTRDVGIFQGKYSQTEDEITDGEYIEADRLDSRTRDMLAGEEIVVLS